LGLSFRDRERQRQPILIEPPYYRY